MKTIFALCGTLMLTLGASAQARISAVPANSFHTATAKAPEPGTMFIYPERVPLKDGSFLHAERAMLFVPLNRSNPDSDVIAVEVYRFKRAAGVDQARPPIFFLHGGPSFDGLEESLAEEGYFEERWQDFTEVSDVVVISQRGIGPSKPATTIEVTIPPQALDQPYSDEIAIAGFQQSLEAERAAWEGLGVDLQGFTVLEAAEDIENTRVALGYDKIVIIGGSFGSHWGMAYMRNYPQYVERAILRGMEGPDHTYDHPGHLWNVYKRVAEEAEASPIFAGKVPEGGFISAVERIVARADREPFTVQAMGKEVLIDGEVIRQLTRGYSGGLANWPADIIAMDNGDFERAAMRMAARQAFSGRNYGTASYWMLDCGSGITPERLAEHDADPANNVLGRWNWWYKHGCKVWDSDLGNDFRQNFRTEIPTVIVHGTWDTSTPYENATELVPYFVNSKFIPVVRGPHGAIRAAFGVSENFKEALFHFAATGDMSHLPDQVELPEPVWTPPQ
ncbi:MAG: alpha/beta fold hydrolase [Saprospiraceae bacterium]|nr:alpha/beta fold hydrolase [Saprospiraceae bacterium]